MMRAQKEVGRGLYVRTVSRGLQLPTAPLHYVLQKTRLMRPPLVALLDLYPRLTAMPNMAFQRIDRMPRKSPLEA